MRKFVALALILVCLLCPVQVCAADATSEGLQAQTALSDAEAFPATAQAAILYEMDTQMLVYAKNPDMTIDPTGLVKLMTAWIAIEEGCLTDLVTVQKSTLNTLAAGAKRLGLQAGEQLTVEELLYCVMVASANDASAVLAEHIAGTQAAFVEKMNERAATLGCIHTHFANVHGLQNANQRSTAREMAVITMAALENPTFAEMFGTVNYRLTSSLSCNAELTTTNELMLESSRYYDRQVTGGKPAAASTADRSVICTAKGENGNYLCIIISATAKTSGYYVREYTNFVEASKLVQLGLQGYRVQQVLGSGQPYGLYAVAEGENAVVVGADQDVYALLPIEFDKKLLQIQDTADEERLVAPVKEGAAVGTLQVFYNGIAVGQATLLARHDVAVRGTTVCPVERRKESMLLTALKWVAVAALCLAVASVGTLLILRYRNQKRHRALMEKRRRREEHGDEVE